VELRNVNAELESVGNAEKKLTPLWIAAIVKNGTQTRMMGRFKFGLWKIQSHARNVEPELRKMAAAII
jgi:hypothetical protein